MTAWLRDENGFRVAIPPTGLLVGRSADCHVVVDDPRVSRRHAIVLPVADGARVVALGKRAVRVNGTSHDPSRLVTAGDRLAIEGATFTLELGASHERGAWAVVLGDRRVNVLPAGLSIGGGTSDDLVIPAWPPGAARLELHGEGVVLARRASLRVDEEEGAGDVIALASGARIEAAGVELVVVRAGVAQTTIDGPIAPSRVELEIVPNGGVLRLVTDREIVVWLPRRRADLVAALLAPTRGARAGEFVDDAALIALVWGTEPADRTQLNTLIHRTRATLTEAGLLGARMIERAPGGGATRFWVRDGADVRVG